MINGYPLCEVGLLLVEVLADGGVGVEECRWNWVVLGGGFCI